MANTVVPDFYIKANNYLRGTKKAPAQNTSRQNVFTGTAENTQSRTANASYGISSGSGTFDFKSDSNIIDSDELKQCQDAYDRWVKSDDYKNTKASYEALTKKKQACDTTKNKVKNFFGCGQKWTDADQKQYDDLKSHIEFMTTRGGLGE